jgi:hypothetical protein
MLENGWKQITLAILFTTFFQLFSNNQQLCSHYQHFSKIGVGTPKVGKMLEKCW